MTTTAPCPEPRTPAILHVRPTPFEDIPRPTWDSLLSVTACPSPFSRWTFHRAWWDAYGETADARYLVVRGAEDERVVGIVPLMTRTHPDAADRSAGPVRRTVFMAASYHADYATILCDPADLPAVCDALACTLRDDPPGAWDLVDLRRLRSDDPTLLDLATALRQATPDWRVTVSQEDVCPVVTLPASGDWEEYLASLDKKARHEIRRKLRRAETVGPVRFRQLPLEPSSVDAFIDLHQARWGDQGLFPSTQDGERSRRFLHRLTSLEADAGATAQLQLGAISVGDRVVVATVAFDDGVTCWFYNAGMDPTARELSPGVTGTAAYLHDRMAAGRRRFDFLRGAEPYKYEWGARDERIERIMVDRA
jgi:CelD/BcsL family acetyltransferase involved in cellulose biosynthesis